MDDPLPAPATGAFSGSSGGGGDEQDVYQQQFADYEMDGDDDVDSVDFSSMSGSSASAAGGGDPILAELSMLTQLCAKYKLPEGKKLPKIAVIGMQAVGKSTLVERFLNGTKVSLSGSGRTTLCPVMYSFRRVQAPSDWDSELPYYSITLSAAFGSRTKVLSRPDDLTGAIWEHMESITRRAESVGALPLDHETLFVSFKTNDPAYTSITIMDLPGLIQNDKDNPAAVQKLNNIARSALRSLGSQDTIIAVFRASDNPSHQYLLNDPSPTTSGVFSIKEIDPELKRTTVVVTMADAIVRDYGIDGGASAEHLRRKLDTYVQEWSKLSGEPPFILNTHHFKDIDEAKPNPLSFADYKAAVHSQMDQKDAELRTWYRALKPKVPEKVFQFDAFMTHIKTRLKKRYEVVREQLRESLQNRTTKLKEEISTSGDALTSGESTESLIRRIVSEFCLEFMADFFGNWYAQRGLEVKKRGDVMALVATYGRSLADDLAEMKTVWPAVSTTAGRSSGDSVFRQYFTSTTSEGYVRLGPVAPPTAGLGTEVEERMRIDLKISDGNGAVERLLRNYVLRLTWVQPTMPDWNSILGHVTAAGAVNLPDLNARLASVVTEQARTLLLKDGFDYLKEGVKNRLMHSVELTTKILFQYRMPELDELFCPGYRRDGVEVKYTLKTMLGDRFKVAVSELLDDVFMSVSQLFLDYYLESMDIHLPNRIELAARMLHPAPDTLQANQHTHLDLSESSSAPPPHAPDYRTLAPPMPTSEAKADDDYPRDPQTKIVKQAGRVHALSDTFRLSGDAIREQVATSKLETLFKQLYQRHFSAIRELLSLVFEPMFRGALRAKITKRHVPRSLHELVLKHVVANAVDKRSDGEVLSTTLEREYQISDARSKLEAKIERAQAELRDVQRALSVIYMSTA